MTGTILDIPSTPADGNRSTLLVPAPTGIANPAAPAVAELIAQTVVQVGPYLAPGGLPTEAAQDTITDERETDTVTRNEPGRKKLTVGPIKGIDNTNADDLDVPNALAEALVEGSHWYAVIRRGVPWDQEFAAGDVVEVVRFKVGARSDVAMTTNSVQQSTWSVFADLRVDRAVVTE